MTTIRDLLNDFAEEIKDNALRTETDPYYDLGKEFENDKEILIDEFMDKIKNYLERIIE